MRTTDLFRHAFLIGCLVCYAVGAVHGRHSSSFQKMDTTDYKIIFLFTGKPEHIAYVPEIEDVLEDLVIYDESGYGKKYAVFNIVRLLIEGQENENKVKEIRQYYDDSLDLQDPNRDVIYDLIRDSLDTSSSFLEVKVKLINEILFFEFIRYDVQNQKGVQKFVYNRNSATSTINLTEVNRVNVKEIFKIAINKVFPKTNQPPEAEIIANKLKINDAYYFGVGDTIRIFGQVVDYDSPEEDFSYAWRQISGKQTENYPLLPNLQIQEIHPKVKNSFQIGLIVNDRINPSEKEDIATFNVIQRPIIGSIHFGKTGSRIARSYYWIFDGAPYYYFDKAPALSIDLLVDERFKLDTNRVAVDIELENANSLYSARALPIRDLAGDYLPSADFQFNYKHRLGERAGIEGYLSLPTNPVAPGNYRIKTSMSQYGVSGKNDQAFLIEMIRVKRWSFLFDSRIGLLTTNDDNQERTLQLNLGGAYKLKRNINIFLLPGVMIFQDEVWQFSARSGVEWELIKLGKNFNNFLGLDLSGSYANRVFTETKQVDGILSISGTAFFKHYLYDRPEIQLKLGIFYEYYENPSFSNTFGLSVGLMFNNFARKSRILASR